MAAPPEDVEMEKIAQDELAKLQRQFRIMEIDRMAVSSSAQPTLRVQRNNIHILNGELENIMLELKLTRSPSNLAASSKVRDKLARLLSEHDKLSSSVRGEREQTQQINFLLRQVGKEIRALSAKGERSEEEYAKTITSYTLISQLENRLANVMKRFSTVNTENLQMRQEIDRLLHDRQSFNVLWKGQMKQLMDGKSLILELVEQAIVTYDQREEWCAKLDELKDKAAHEYRKHCLEVRDLQRQLDYRMKLEDFLRAKGAARLTAGDAKAEAKRLEQEEREQQIYNNYVNILDSIKEFTGEVDIDKIIQEFIRREEENYALFNYVNEVNSELKLIHDSVKVLRDNLEEEREKHEARVSQQQDSTEGLQQALSEQQVVTGLVEAEARRSREILDKLLASVHQLALSAQCDSLPLVRLLGSNATTNAGNVRLYLKCVEKKIIEVAEIIRADEMLRRQSSTKEKTPPSSRHKSSARSPRRSPRAPAAAPPRATRDKLLAAH